MDRSVVYCIRNLTNNKMYVGSAVNFRKRVVRHLNELNKKIHHNQKLLRSWHKHGAVSFVFEILEKVHDKTKLLEAESRWIAVLRTTESDKGYNICAQATSRYGAKNTPEHRAKISAANRGRKLSPEHCLQMATVRRGVKRGPRPPEVVEKYAAAQRGVKRKPHTAEAKAKISAANKGRQSRPPAPLTQEHRAAISKGLTGKKRKPFTAEHRQRIADAARRQAALRKQQQAAA